MNVETLAPGHLVSFARGVPKRPGSCLQSSVRGFESRHHVHGFKRAPPFARCHQGGLQAETHVTRMPVILQIFRSGNYD